MTEALAIEGGKILLGRKKKEGFGSGKWVGLGGKIEEGETIEGAMVRECQEEASIEVTKYKKSGILTFYYVDGPDMEVHYYQILSYKNKPTDSDEMEVAWIDIDKIPYDLMWPNDKYWFPMFLKGELFEGYFRFNEK